MPIPTENVGSLPRPAKLQAAIADYDTGKITHEDLNREPDIARDIAFQKVAARVQGTAMASERLGIA